MVSQSIVYRHQAEGIGEAAEAWKAAHDEAQQVCDLEDVLSLGVALVAALTKLQEKAFAALFSGRAIRLQRFGLIQRELYACAIRAFALVEEGVAVAQKDGYNVTGDEAFTEAFQNLRVLQDDFLRQWPLATPEDAKRGQEEISEGRAIRGEDLFRELAGDNR